MIASPTLSRRTKAAILSWHQRRTAFEQRLAARRATQAAREQTYRDRQTRQILAASAVDIIKNFQRGN